MVDIHQHIVFGIDDGARNLQMTADMLSTAYKQGVSSIIATPHVSPGMMRFDYEGYIQRLNAINRYAHNEGLGVKLYPGAEILYTPSTLDELDAGRIPTLCQGGCVLVEFMPDESYDSIFEAMRTLANGGYTPVLAHVERYYCLIGHINRIIDLKEQLDVLIQMNCRTVIRPGGLFFGRFCGRLIKEGVVDFVASDAHNTSSRPVLMQEAYHALASKYGEDVAEGLTRMNQMDAFEGLI